METTESLRERLEALEHIGVDKAFLGLLWRVGTLRSGLLMALLIGALGLAPPLWAAEFTCASGDVACLIDAINQANANGEANTITLEAGTYTLTAVDNTTDGFNGLPSVTGVVTIQGAGADTTILERDTNAPGFRLVHVAATGVLTLDGLTLQGGRAGVFGGGAGLFNRGALSLTHITVAHNSAGGGGAGGLLNSGGTATIAMTKFVNNDVFVGGGGILNEGGTLLITTTTFAGNFSEGVGGLANQGGTVILTDSTFVDNGGDGSGAISNAFGTNGVVVLTNSTIARNFVRPILGGSPGLRNGPSGTVILTNSTVADNTGRGRAAGAALVNAPGGTVILTNTILARNTNPPAGQPSDCSGPVTSLGTNLIGDPTGCTITLLPTDLTGDPGLGDFTDDGTPGNGHFRLLRRSPAIDAGNDAFCAPTDQLGRRRVGPCDIGAIEFQGKHHK
jgi:hypothetical protein